MKKADVQIGGRYLAKVSGEIATIRITGASPFGGWDAVNTRTGRAVRVKSAARLRAEAPAPKARMVRRDGGWFIEQPCSERAS